MVWDLVLVDKFSGSSWIIVLAKFLYTGKANPLAENVLTPSLYESLGFSWWKGLNCNQL